MVIVESDKRFIQETLMPYFNVKKLTVSYVPSTKKWPDIWVEPTRPVPRITVTETWKRKSMRQRRIELVHECLHLSGLEHGRMGRFVYHTKPELDSYSELVYEAIIRG